MKTLTMLPIAGALLLYGGAFSEVWTAPGLENLPTYQTVLTEGPREASPASTGITPVSPKLPIQPAGVTAHSETAGQGPSVVPLPSSKDFVYAGVAASESRKLAVNRKALPPRWYTTNPLPPKPEVRTTRSSGGYSSNSRATQTSTSGGRAASGSGRSRNYSTSRQRSSRVR